MGLRPAPHAGTGRPRAPGTKPGLHPFLEAAQGQTASRGLASAKKTEGRTKEGRNGGIRDSEGHALSTFQANVSLYCHFTSPR